MHLQLLQRLDFLLHSCDLLFRPRRAFCIIDIWSLFWTDCALHGLVMSAEGVLLGKEDVNYLGWMYGAFFFVMPAFMLRVKHLALHAGRPATLQSIWGIFLGYQLARMALWCGRSALGGGGGGNRRGRS